jgi:GNAT superfamily N-acetyltransferase
MVTVGVMEKDELDAFVGSVTGLFEEDGGTHDPYMDTSWPVRAGADYYGGLVGDDAVLLAVARDGDRVVGHLVGKLAEPNDLRHELFAVLESVRVDPAARGRGVGGLLVGQFLSWARERGAVQASVSAFAANAGAQRFYQRHGFAPQTITLRAPVGPR